MSTDPCPEDTGMSRPVCSVRRRSNAVWFWTVQPQSHCTSWQVFSPSPQTPPLGICPVISTLLGRQEGRQQQADEDNQTSLRREGGGYSCRLTSREELPKVTQALFIQDFCERRQILGGCAVLQLVFVQTESSANSVLIQRLTQRGRSRID